MNTKLDLSNYRILHLTLKKEAFDVMVTGEKQVEYREPSDWIKSRLYYRDGYIKEYHYIKFTKGYGKDKPYFIIKYWGFGVNYSDKLPTQHYSNGLTVDVKPNDYILYLGKIVETGNLEAKSK